MSFDNLATRNITHVNLIHVLTSNYRRIPVVKYVIEALIALRVDYRRHHRRLTVGKHHLMYLSTLYLRQHINDISCAILWWVDKLLGYAYYGY